MVLTVASVTANTYVVHCVQGSWRSTVRRSCGRASW